MSLLYGDIFKLESTKKAKELVGKRITFLTKKDIDKSGRGFFFPRNGIVEEVYARNLRINGDWINFGSFVEIVINLK